MVRGQSLGSAPQGAEEQFERSGDGEGEDKDVEPALGNSGDEALAEEQAAAAARTEKARAGSATGGGRTMALRTQAYAGIENFRAVFMHFEHRQEVKDVLQRLADAAIRGGEDVPGANRLERQVAA